MAWGNREKPKSAVHKEALLRRLPDLLKVRAFTPPMAHGVSPIRSPPAPAGSAKPTGTPREPPRRSTPSSSVARRIPPTRQTFPRGRAHRQAALTAAPAGGAPGIPWQQGEGGRPRLTEVPRMPRRAIPPGRVAVVPQHLEAHRVATPVDGAPHAHRNRRRGRCAHPLCAHVTRT